MIINPSYFRKTGRDKLKGDWQTALLVTFFSGFFLTAVSTLIQVIAARLVDGTTDLMYSFLSATTSQNQSEMLSYGLSFLSKAQQNLQNLPEWIWIALAACAVLGVLFTPVLKLSEHRYYLDRHAGLQPSFVSGLTSHFRYFVKALGLYALMILKIFLWWLITVPVIVAVSFLQLSSVLISLLTTISGIPAILAFLRYLFAPYAMAENPKLGIRESIRISKNLTKKRISALVAVGVNFLMLNLALTLVLSILESIGLPDTVVTVASLAGSLFIDVYMMSTFTGLYQVMAHKEVEETMNKLMRVLMRERGMDEEMIERMMSGKPPMELKKDDEPSDNVKDQNDDSNDRLD